MEETLNNKMNLISIILPVYNGEKFLSQAIESCLNQTYKNIELIIVNDCSTDATLFIANGYAEKDSRVRIVNNKENKKLPASLNVGHHQAKGDFITWTSDDNIYELNALEELLNELLKKKADIVYSDFILINDLGNEIRKVELLGIENVVFGNYIGSCFLYKKEVFERNRGYDEKLFLVEDYDFWLRAISHSQYSQLKKNLYKYRKHEQSLTNVIATNEIINQRWRENVNTMYLNFCKTILSIGSEEIATLLSKKLTHQKIDFDWIIQNNYRIVNFKAKLQHNVNFLNGALMESVFLKKTIEIMTVDQNFKSNLSKSLFIVKNYTRVLDKKDVKTLIKYSFFK